MSSPKVLRCHIRGMGNRSYIPQNAERLEAKFGNRRKVTDPIRYEIELAYEEGYWAAVKLFQGEVHN